MVGVTQRSRSDRALRLVTDWCNGGSLQSLLNDAFGGDEMEVWYIDDKKEDLTCLYTHTIYIYTEKTLHRRHRCRAIVWDRDVIRLRIQVIISLVNKRLVAGGVQRGFLHLSALDI